MWLCGRWRVRRNRTGDEISIADIQGVAWEQGVNILFLVRLAFRGSWHKGRLDTPPWPQGGASRVSRADGNRARQWAIIHS